MTLPTAGRGGQPLYAPVSSTVTVANGALTASFTGTAFVSTDPSGVQVFAIATADELIVDGVASVKIKNIVDPTNVTLMTPWPAASQVAIPAGSYYIVRNTLSPNAAVQKTMNDVLNAGSDLSPFGAVTVDDTTARLKARLKGGVAVISVGATGATDTGAGGTPILKDAISIDPATGVVSFPVGMKEYQLGFRNRLINGNFDVAQFGTTFTFGAGAAANYCLDRWFVFSTTIAVTATKVAPPAGFRGTSALNLVGTALGAAGFINLGQRFEAQMVADLDSVASTLSFDLNATTTAGSLTGTLQLALNSALDNGTFNSNVSNIAFTIPIGSGKVIVPITAAQTAGIKNGGQISFVFTQNASSGNPNITIGAVQLERGVVANDFEFRTIQIVRQLCRWYARRDPYWIRFTASSAIVIGDNTVSIDMRVTPTASLVAAGTRSANITAVSLSPSSSTGAKFELQSNATGDTYALNDIWDLRAEL
jgi:hypothetical protein